jgi:uncharacterized membrane protein YkvA (DUF1232 family)
MNEKEKSLTRKPVSGFHQVLPLPIRLLLSFIFLVATIIYTVSPIDLIPDILGPIGWVDDIGVWLVAFILDIKLLARRGVKKANEANQGIKGQGSFFSEDVND